MFSRILMAGVHHRLITFFCLALITAALGMGLPHLHVDTGFKRLVSKTDPHAPVYDQIIREFGSDNRTIVYVRDPGLWSPDKLAALEALHYDLEELDFVDRVDDLFTVRNIRGTGGKIDSRLVLPEAPTDQAAIDTAKTMALNNPLIVDNFLSRHGTATALMVSLKTEDEPEHDHRINQILERTLQPARSVLQEVFQVGTPRINAELRETLVDDLTRLGPLSAILLVIAILFFLRSGFAAIVPLVTSGLSILWTFGMMGWAGIPLNILGVMLPSLIVVIGSTEDTHMMAAYFQGIAQSSEKRRMEATRFMLKHLGMPLVLTILTTAMGFASNIFSGMGIIRDFALAATFALLANGVITILLVPLLLSISGPRRTTLFRDPKKAAGIPGIFVRVFGFTNRRFPRLVLAVTGILCVFFIYQLSKIYVTNDPLSYFEADRPLIGEIQQIHQDLAGMKVFFIRLASDEDNAFKDPRNIEKLVAIQEFLERQGIFDNSISLADHLALIHREFNDGDPNYHTIPHRRDRVAQYLLFLHRRDLQSYVSHDYRRANIVVRHNVSDSNVLNRHVRELRDVVSNIAGGQMKGDVAGENLMINAAAEDLMVAQVRSLAMLLLVIFLIMSAMFTSFKGGLISLIPNLVPIILMFGLMGFMKIPLNPGTAMVAVIAIGIAIDGTIHLFARYNDLCRRTSDYGEAVETTVREEATPMVATTLALALGFGILLVSDFTLVAQFGALSAITMIFALFANLLITPIIMTRIRLVGLHQIMTLHMHKAILENSPLFKGMTNYQIRKAILISELNEFEAGELLVEQGTLGRSMYLVLSGQVDIIRKTGTREKHVATLDTGEVFGEIGFIRETRRTADVRALTRVEALRFDYRKIHKDLKFFPRIVARLNFNISCILGERLADVMDEMDSLSGRSKKERPDDPGSFVGL